MKTPRTAEQLGSRNLTGIRAGSLTVVGLTGRRGASTELYWDCACDCGGKIAVRSSQIRTGRVKTCGCSKRRSRKDPDAKTRHPLYKTWTMMKARCSDEKLSHYPRYGGRGIRVCERWLESFENFLADMGEKPTPSHSLDRIDVNGNYEPLNCRWATRTEQMQNTRANKVITQDGESLCLAEWARRLGVCPTVIWSRLDRGWSEIDAITVPLGARKGGFKCKA